jgi:hypothetical protein
MLYYASVFSYGLVVMAFDISVLGNSSQSSHVKTTPFGMPPGFFGLGLEQSAKQTRICMADRDCSPDEFCKRYASEKECEVGGEGECTKMKLECNDDQKFEACGCDGYLYESPCSFVPYTRIRILQMGSCPSPYALGRVSVEPTLQKFIPSGLQNIKAPAAPFGLPAKAGSCIKTRCAMETQRCYNDNFCTAIMGCIDRCSKDDCVRNCLSTSNSIYADQLYRCAIQRDCLGNTVQYV